MKRHHTLAVLVLLFACAIAVLPATRAHAQDGESDPERAPITADNIDQLVELAAIPHHHREVWSVAFSPDGTLLATGDYDGLIRLWDVTDPGAIIDPVVAWDAHDLHVYALDFVPQGVSFTEVDQLVSAGWDGAIRLWDLSDLAQVQQLGEFWQGEPVYALDVHPNGTLLASGSGYSANEVRLWDIAERRLVSSAGDHYDWVTDVAFSPNGLLLVSTSADGAWRQWTLELDDPPTVVREHEGPVGGIAFTTDSSLMATSSLDATIKLWSPISNAMLQSIDTGGYVWDVGFSPDGTLLVAGARDGALTFWDAVTGEFLRSVQAHDNWVNSFAFSPDGTLLVTGGENGVVRLWGVE